MKEGAFHTNKYPDLFAEIGLSGEQIEKKICESFNTMFFDPEERIYFEKG